jgi:hypothetical protein
MRTLVLLILVTLLPLRSWAGDVMAMEMAMQELSVAAPNPNVLEATRHDHDCVGHAEVAVVDGVVPAHTDLGHCDTCTVCQACQSVALLGDFPLLSLAHVPAQVRRAEGAGFSSAEPRPSLKPPIA